MKNNIKTTTKQLGWLLAVSLLLTQSFFKVCAQGAEVPTTNRPLDSLAALRDRVQMGAEIFLDPSYTPEEIQTQFRRMRETGLTVARVFIIWDHIEHQPGKWNFQLYDEAYQAAAANGISMLATLCPEDPPAWAGQSPFYHAKLPIFSTPHLQERGAEYIKQVVTHFRNHPAQGPWSLENEPAGLAESFDPDTLHRFGEWLHRKYGSLDNLNRHWFRPSKSFDQVNFGPEELNGYWIDYVAAVDWKWFRIQLQTDQLAWVRDQVRLYDSKHPLHAHPSALADNMLASGADLWSEKQVLDFVGTTIHVSWQLGSYRTEDIDLGMAFITDLLRSGSGGAPWWITELQAGLSLSGRQFNPAADELTRWLWDDVGAGAKGVNFWCWNPRRFGREGGEWGLVNADGSTTSRSEAVSRFTQALAGSASFLNHAEPLPARVAILYNRENLVLGSIDHSNDRVMLSLLGCHRALCERQIPVDFINEDDLKSGAVNHYAVLYLPYCYAIDDDCVAALRKFVSDGGTVWADGPVAWKKEYGQVRPEIPGGLTDVFGVKVEDILPTEGAFALTPQDRQAGDEMRLPLTLCGADVLAKDAQGRPVATLQHYGKGKVYFYGTALALGYHRHPDSQAGDWIAAPVHAATREMSVSATTDAKRVFFRGLKCPEGLAAILTNPGDECSVLVSFRGSVRNVKNVLTSEDLKVDKHEDVSEITVKVPAGGVTILLARTE